MLKVSKRSAHRVDIDLDYRLDVEDMAKGLDELIEASKGVSNGRMLYTITDFAGPSLGALAAEMARFPKLLGLLSSFDRCAVLSDKKWLRKAAEIEGGLIPGLEIKSFEKDKLEQAEEWLSATP